MRRITRWMVFGLLILASGLYAQNSGGGFDSDPGAGSYGERDFIVDGAYERAVRFAEDLEEHDVYGLFLALDLDYAIGQLELTGAYPMWLTVESISMLLFNGAVLYEDYSNTIESLEDIDEVIEYVVDDSEERVYFLVRLTDGRDVTFSLFIDFGTLLFYGVFG